MNILARKVYDYFVINNGILLIIFVWIASVFLVNPIGEFPLNDDWVYLQSLKYLYDHNQLMHSDWISSTLISQIIWALLFCKIFGYSIFIARVSTMVSSLLIAVILNSFIKNITGNKNISLLITAVFIFNPVLYVNSFTFMTESSFNLLILLCVYSSFKYINDFKINSLVICTFWGCIAVLLKQPGLIIAACLPFTLLINRHETKNVIMTALSLAIIISCYSLYMWWLNTKFSNPQHVNGVNDNLLINIKAGSRNWFLPQRENLMVIIMYVGLFLIPLWPVLIASGMKLINKLRLKIYSVRPSSNSRSISINFYFNCLLAILLVLIAWFSWKYTDTTRIPCIENVFYNFGLGPLLLFDTFILKINLAEFEIPLTVFRWISFFSFFMGASVFLICTFMFLLTVFNSFYNSANSKTGLLFQLLFCSAAIYTFLLVNVYMFDRYILALALIVLIMYSIVTSGIISAVSRIYFILSYTLAGGTLLFGILATHDYMEWNRAKWKALNMLTIEHGKSPEEIDGGYEFNGIHNYNVDYKPASDKSWWWVHDNKYIVSMGMIPNYSVYLEVSYTSWLFQESRVIYVVERND